MKTKTADYLGRGIYSIPQAARLLRLPVSTLRRWIGDRKDAAPILHRDFAAEGLLTFSELMELQFVKMFHDEGVSLQSIRKAAIEAARKFGTEHPFAVKRFDTDGRRIFATLIGKESQAEVVEELRHGQRVFKDIIQPFFRKIRYNDQRIISEFWPLEESGRIVLDPMRRYGEPIDAETGVPVETILNALRAGGGQDPLTVANWLGIPLEAVEAATRYDQLLAA